MPYVIFANHCRFFAFGHGDRHTGERFALCVICRVIVKSAHDLDLKSAWKLCSDMKAGEDVVLDKASVDFKHLKALSNRGVSWVTRSKENMLYEVMGQQTAPRIQNDAYREPASTEPETHADLPGKDRGQQVSGKRRYIRKKCRILLDERLKLTEVNTKEHCPEELRLVTAERGSPETACQLTLNLWP